MYRYCQLQQYRDRLLKTEPQSQHTEFMYDGTWAWKVF